MDVRDINMVEFNYLTSKPGVVLLHGMIGSGKTSAAFKIAELIHRVSPDREIYVYTLDHSKSAELEALLPNWFKTTPELSMKKLPSDSVLISDEAWYSSSSKVRHKDDEIMNIMDNLFLSRQRGQTLVSIIQSLAILEKTHFRAGFTLVSKYTPMDTIATERQELIDILGRIQRGMEYRLSEYPVIPFEAILHVRSPFCSLNEYKYRFVDGYCNGYYSLDLPEFWSDELSTFWSVYT